MNPMTQAYQAEMSAEWEQRVVDFLPLVHHVVGRLLSTLPPLVERDELYASGVCGLLQAAKTYDPTKGASFKTHAYTRIRGAILDEVRRADAVPREKRRLLRQISEAHNRLSMEHCRPPTLEELAEDVGATPERLDEVLALAQRTSLLSLDAGAGGDQADTTPLVDRVSAPNAATPLELASLAERKETLVAALRLLPEREREVLGLYYYEGLLLREIGELLGVSESRVCQLHARAVYELRGTMLLLERGSRKETA